MEKKSMYFFTLVMPSYGQIWNITDVSGEKLDIVLNLYQYLGYLGFTFQAAIISDMICLATFHSYCIYVYAAR